MKMIITTLLLLAGCTDAEWADLTTLGKSGHVTCFSGGVKIYEGDSTGKIATVHNSDGWQFQEKGSEKFIRVSGDCIIKN